MGSNAQVADQGPRWAPAVGRGYHFHPMPRIRAESIAEHKAMVQRQILDAAAALFRAQGYADTSLGDVAAYVGIGRTTLYEYFSDKEDLLASVVEDRIPALMDALISGIPTDITVTARLAELIVRGIEYVSSDEDLGSMLMRETPRVGREAQIRIRATHQVLLDEITALCAEGIASGEFKHYDPDVAGRLVFANLWSASQALIHDADAKQKRHEAAETLVRFVIGGLTARD
jgi:AcrR family transcriptional regulator